MRTLFITLLIALTLVACSAKDDAMEQPVAESAAATAEPEGAGDEAAPAQEADRAPASTLTITDVVPDGPVGTVRLTDGSTMELNRLIKIGNYYLYITGKLNGRTSTAISLTRFSDLQRWESIVFKDPNTFTITTKTGKEMVFADARLYLGSGSADSYTFVTLDDRYNTVETTIPKADVAIITIR